MELARRRMVFHLAGGRTVESTVLRGSFEAALGEVLAEPRFLQPHKSFAVNMDHVRLHSGLRLSMADGTQIPVAVRKRAQVMERIFSYWRISRAGDTPRSPSPEAALMGKNT